MAHTKCKEIQKEKIFQINNFFLKRDKKFDVVF